MSTHHNLKNHIIEWLIWMALITVFYAQIDTFSQTIAEYRFGADGWPRVVLICLALGATAQLVFSYREYKTQQSNSVGAQKNAENTAEATQLQSNDLKNTEVVKQVNIWQQIGIFVTPLLYLWCMQRMGFFFTTPFFILGYLLILEVRNIKTLISVTAIVYGFVLLIFVRLFYVAMPVGNWPTFYDINNWIITTVRMGV